MSIKRKIISISQRRSEKVRGGRTRLEEVIGSQRRSEKVREGQRRLEKVI
jgi:hypothetical protein